MTQIIQQSDSHYNNNFSSSTVVSNETIHPSVRSLSILARKKSKRPLAKLQYILYCIIRDDCKLQGYCDRSIEEFANLSAHSEDGVKKALKVLNREQYIFTKKQTRGYNSVRVINRENLPKKRQNKKAPQKAPQKNSTLYKISYSSSEKEKTDLLARESILKTSRREEECFRALEFSETDELIILCAIKRSQLSQDKRFRLANSIMAAHYKNVIQSPRAYFLKAIQNEVND